MPDDASWFWRFCRFHNGCEGHSIPRIVPTAVYLGDEQGAPCFEGSQQEMFMEMEAVWF